MPDATPGPLLVSLISDDVGRGFAPRARTFLLAAFGLIVLAGVAAVMLVLRANSADALVAHTFEVRQAASDLLSEMQDAETGQRGFLLTGDVRYLGPFERADKSAGVAFEKLRGLTADNASQGRRLAALKPIVDAKFAELRRTVALARDGHRDEALGIVRSNRGKALMDNIRLRVSAISHEELGLLTRREADARWLRTWTLALIGLSLIAAVGLAALLAQATQTYVERLKAAKLELEAEARLRHEVEDTLRQSQKIEAVGQLSGGIAHDFNNMLTVIMGAVDRVQLRLAAAPPGALVSDVREAMAKLLGVALQGCNSAAQLTHRLLAFSRRQALAPERVDLNRLVSGMHDLLHRSLGETIQVETVLAGGLWPTFVDANQLESALLNLAVNARDAMPDGGRLTIESANIHLDEAYVRRFGDVAAGQYVVLSVTDSGEGIAADVLEKVFEPFFTTKDVGTGTGLGLAMVHGFVKQSGGHVRIYSEVGHGTTVKLYLPRLLQAEQTATPPEKSPYLPPPERAHAFETILLVEDNDGVRDYAASVLEELGYSVLAAADAEEALGLLDGASRLDLLFTDVILPGSANGRELSKQVLARRPGLPVLFTTGYTRNAIVHQGRLDPDVNLLGKPYTQQDLARRIRELLDKVKVR